jgi:ribosomal protein S18 acetylase RimI-like enzyme
MTRSSTARDVEATAREHDEREGSDDWREAGFRLPGDAVVLDDADGRTVAVGWLEAAAARTVLHAFWRDITYGGGLIDALVGSAASAARDGAGWLRIERVLKSGTGSLPEVTTALYKTAGFEFVYVELEMARDLSELAQASPLAAGVSIQPWTPERDAMLREAYNDAFSTRGFAGYTADDWVSATFSAQPDFLPACSFLAIVEGGIAGFVMALRDREEGWVDSVGVRTAWRGRGIADALLLASMSAMREADMLRAVLRVNEDNDRAIAVYRRLGLQVRRKHAVWRKTVAAP